MDEGTDKWISEDKGPISFSLMGKGIPFWALSVSELLLRWIRGIWRSGLLFYIFHRFIFCCALSRGLCPADFPSPYLCLHDLVGIYWVPGACQVLSMDKRHSSDDTTAADSLTRDQDEYQVAVRWGDGYWGASVRLKVCVVEAHGWGWEALTWGQRNQGKCLTELDWESRVEMNSTGT